ncbi:MAG: fructose-1,6-bisphosphatase, partial [Planctomycetales bacterium]|nr:fructose-1,6-bisphosphatase [Planctomycetales bacterium]
VHGFTLDPSIGAFVLTHPDMRMPDRGMVYSVNEAYADSFPPYCNRFLHWLKSGEDDVVYRSRYIGSLVADFHRLLLKGGIFMYPPTASYPDGKLRLVYEANPMAFLAEQAGGLATDGRNRILDMTPEGVHQRTSLFLGSPLEMNKLHVFADRPLKV